MNLKNKVVLVTGSSDGLGRSLAIKLAKEGAKIALVARSEDKLKEVKEIIGKQAEYFICDISQPDQIKTTIAKIQKKFKSIDALINCAGVWLQGPTDQTSPEKIVAMFQANTLGLINLTSLILPILKTRPEAMILNVISDSGIDPNPNWGAYVGSKFAVKGFTDSLKLELKNTNIKVMAIYPGGMNTDLFFKAGNQYHHEPWMMNKEDVTDVIIFMLTRPQDVVINDLVVRKFLGGK